MPRIQILTVSALAIAMAGCMTAGQGSAQRDEGPSGVANLATARGEQVAVMEVGEQGGAIYVVVDASNMAPGRYGVHLHSVGRCDGPGFESAGPHWNPTGRQHGLDNDAGAHLGDLPNIAINAGGRGAVAFQIQNASLTSGPNALLDADGAAIVVHADEDDFRTDPSGNSGPRIACGVVRRAG